MQTCHSNPSRALTTVMTSDLSLLRLLQLVSPGLPIGMYSYSQGLECAIDEGRVCDAESAAEWFTGLLGYGFARVDLPILARLYDAWQANDEQLVVHWSSMLRACRETGELRAEDRQTGQALARLLAALDFAEALAWQRRENTSLATLFSLAAVRWHISKFDALTGYTWSWLENQVLCAVKLLPLGQVAGQRLLTVLAGQIPAKLHDALTLADTELGGGVFGLALSSSRHEMQYSRLFRS